MFSGCFFTLIVIMQSGLRFGAILYCGLSFPRLLTRMTRLIILAFLLGCAQNIFGQSYLTATTIIPEKDMYYLANWHLNSDVKSVRIKTYQPRNVAMRYNKFDACRENAKAGSDFMIREEAFDFNRKGQLLKTTNENGSEKTITLFSYNYFGKISAIESGEKMVVFQYDLIGRLVRKEIKQGARTNIYSDLVYKGDSVITVTHDLYSGANDTLTEILDKQGRIIYSGNKTTLYGLRETHIAYDESGRIMLERNNTGLHKEYLYDDQGRLVQVYIGACREFMANYEYDHITGIVKTTRMELRGGQYISRNYECKCTAIDGHNNPVRSEFIDCVESSSDESYCMNQFYEVEYDYFK